MSGLQTAIQSRTTLLLVEDDEVDAKWALRALSRSPFTIEHVDTLESALNRLSANQVHLVLLDLGLPDASDDVASIERIHALRPHIPIIVYSGSTYEHTGLQAMEKGALYFFPKAMHDGERLASTVQRAVERFQMQENLRRVVESSGDGMAIFSSNQRLLFANPAAQFLLNINPLTSYDYTFPYVLAPERTTEIKLAGDVIVELRAVPVEWNGHAALLATLRDVSQRKLLERQLRQGQKMEAVGMLASGLAHDFNNILTVITGFTELAIEKLPESSSTRDDLAEVKAAGERASALIRRLLTFSREDETTPGIIDVDQVVTDAHAMLRRLISEDIDLILSTAAGNRRIYADPAQISQVVVNLVINARDAMPAGGTLMVETYGKHLDAEFPSRYLPPPSPGEFLVLAVTDSGAGMTDEVMEHLFEPFYTTKDSGEGTGLGLAITYAIVQQNQGIIDVVSKPGRGTTMKIYFPCVDAWSIEHESAQDADAGFRGDETILLVEDEDSVRHFVAQFLTASGYTVIEAPNPEDALAIVAMRIADLDLIITDIVMPGMNGREMSEKLKQERPELPVLFMSGYASEVVVDRGILSAGSRFLQKPFTPGALGSLVREILDNGG